MHPTVGGFLLTNFLLKPLRQPRRRRKKHTVVIVSRTTGKGGQERGCRMRPSSCPLDVREAVDDRIRFAASARRGRGERGCKLLQKFRRVSSQLWWSSEFASPPSSFVAWNSCCGEFVGMSVAICSACGESSSASIDRSSRIRVFAPIRETSSQRRPLSLLPKRLFPPFFAPPTCGGLHCAP